MTRDPQRLGDYLDHIIEAIDRIHRYTDGMDVLEFLRNELVQDGVIRNLEVIGEASRNISRAHPEFAAAHPELPLAIAYDMRNSLAHGYFQGGPGDRLGNAPTRPATAACAHGNATRRRRRLNQPGAPRPTQPERSPSAATPPPA